MMNDSFDGLFRNSQFALSEYVRWGKAAWIDVIFDLGPSPGVRNFFITGNYPFATDSGVHLVDVRHLQGFTFPVVLACGCHDVLQLSGGPGDRDNCGDILRYVIKYATP